MTDPHADRAAELERFRGYLHLLARLQAGSLQTRTEPSDIVQQTMVQALAGLDGFRGTSDAELAAWLRQILARQLANLSRDLGRQKRDVSRERSLEAALDQSSSRLQVFLAAKDASPSQQVQRDERMLLVSTALAELPNAQREAIVLHHLQGKSLDEVSHQLQRTTVAVAGLIKRGLRTLRLRLQNLEASRTPPGPSGP